jgi:hypothetical protein
MKCVNNVWHDISVLLIAVIWSARVVSVETSRSIRICLLLHSPRKESLTDRSRSLCFANANEHKAVVFPASSCTLLLNSFHFPLSFLLLPSLHWRRFTLLPNLRLPVQYPPLFWMSFPSSYIFSISFILHTGTFSIYQSFVYLSSSSLQCYFHLMSSTHHSWRLLYMPSYTLQIT